MQVGSERGSESLNSRASFLMAEHPFWWQSILSDAILSGASAVAPAVAPASSDKNHYTVSRTWHDRHPYITPGGGASVQPPYWQLHLCNMLRWYATIWRLNVARKFPCHEYIVDHISKALLQVFGTHLPLGLFWYCETLLSLNSRSFSHHSVARPESHSALQSCLAKLSSKSLALMFSYRTLFKSLLRC